MTLRFDFIKIFIPLLFALAICCSKDHDTPPVIIGGAITVTSMSPDQPYLDEVMTLTGTGFSTDTSKLKIEFGLMIGINGTFQGSWTGVPNARLKVISATPTQIKFTASDPQLLDQYITSNHSIAVKVSSDGASALLLDQKINFLPKGAFPEPFGGPTWALHPGENYFIAGRGFTSGCSNKVWFTRCDLESCGTLDQLGRCNCPTQSLVDISCLGEDGYLSFSIPVEFYGVTFDDCKNGTTPDVIRYQASMTIENQDGKKSKAQYVFVDMCPEG